MKNLKNKTKDEIKSMKLKCPFCGQEMVFIEDDWTDSQMLNGEWHSARSLIFEHASDPIDDKPWVESDCLGGEVSYLFVESKSDPELQAKAEVTNLE